MGRLWGKRGEPMICRFRTWHVPNGVRNSTAPQRFYISINLPRPNIEKYGYVGHMAKLTKIENARSPPALHVVTIIDAWHGLFGPIIDVGAKITYDIGSDFTKRGGLCPTFARVGRCASLTPWVVYRWSRMRTLFRRLSIL